MHEVLRENNSRFIRSLKLRFFFFFPKESIKSNKSTCLRLDLFILVFDDCTGLNFHSGC